ncbi:MAG: heat shock protein HspQ [Candidatus Thiodiazotropha sp.]
MVWYATESVLTGHAKYGVGELVHHRLFNYQGIVVDIDPVFMLSDEWYELVSGAGTQYQRQDL